MSVSYAPTKIKVPDGFESLVEDLTRRILAEQPKDVISFAATYLKGKLHYVKGTGYFVFTVDPNRSLSSDQALYTHRLNGNGFYGQFDRPSIRCIFLRKLTLSSTLTSNPIIPRPEDQGLSYK